MSSYSIKMNRKERRLALKSALAYKASENNIIVIDSFNIENAKTSEAKKVLNTLTNAKNILVVVDELTESMILATRNLQNVILLEASEVNTYDVVAADVVIIEEAATKKIEEVLK